MTSAWAAVIVAGVAVAISAATTLANYAGTKRAGETQVRIAHEQQIGDRRTETYLDLLRWADEAEEKVRHARGALDAWEAVELPESLALRAYAFANDDVNAKVEAFQNAWLKVNVAAQKREKAIMRAVAESFKTKDASVIDQVFPEAKAARAASDQIRQAVRAELKPK
jgi:hypothetical protein